MGNVRGHVVRITSWPRIILQEREICTCTTGGISLTRWIQYIHQLTDRMFTPTIIACPTPTSKHSLNEITMTNLLFVHTPAPLWYKLAHVDNTIAEILRRSNTGPLL